MTLWSPSVTDAFRSDDYVVVHGVAPPAWELLIGKEKAGTTFYRPWSLLSFKLDRMIGGTSPIPYHLTNIVLFGAVILLLFVLLETLFQRRAPAVLAAATVALHPSAGGFVGWVSGRPELLAAFFGLASTYVLYLSIGEKRPCFKRLTLSAMLMMLALLSKESALLWPVVQAVMIGLLRKQGRAAPWWCVAPGAGMVAVSLALRTAVLHGVGGFGPLHFGFGFYVLRNAARYVQAFVLPTSPAWLLPWLLMLEKALIPMALAGIAVAGYALRRWALRGPALFGLALVAAAFLPVGNLFPEGQHALLINAGLALVVASVIVPFWDRGGRVRRIAAGLALVWLIVLTGFSIRTVVTTKIASRIAADLVAQSVKLLDESPETEQFIALAVPDAYQGAYVMRNGLHQAIRLARPKSTVVTHEFLLFGMGNNPERSFHIQRDERTRYLARIAVDTGGYLLLPDGIWSRHDGDVVSLGPVTYRFLTETIPFRPNEIELLIDPEFLGKKKTLLVAYDQGVLRAPTNR